MRSLFVFSLALASLAVVGCRGQSGSTATCTPGESVVIGCDATVGRECTGDPTLSICDAARVPDPENCTSSSGGFIDDDDDSGSDLCPVLTVICPSSGRISINPNRWSGSSRAWSCEYAVVRGGIGP